MTASRAALTTLAHAHGFKTVRFATLGPTPRAEVLHEWLAANHHGDMRWMGEQLDVRDDPRVRLPDGLSAMVLAVEHAHVRPPDPGGRTGMVARYAWGRDYHNLVGKRLDKLRAALRASGVRNWGGVDTAPILERAWAAEAGLGFNGKNGVQILPARTSWMFLAVLFVDVEIPPDPPLRDHCGRCERCLVACPTQAFTAPHRLDARRCLSYWTIEARGLAPHELRAGFGRWVFGCDVCQEVCPHNAAPPDPEEADLMPRHAWLDLDEVITSPDDLLMTRFTGTPLRRPKAHGLKRNALIVLGNLGDEGGVPSARLALDHPHEVVRGAAVWALARLGAPIPQDDPSAMVRDEIHAVLDGLVPAARSDGSGVAG